jgi:transposase
VKKESHEQIDQLRHENRRLKKRNRRLNQRLEQLEKQRRELEVQKRQLEEQKRYLESQLMEYREKFFKPKAQACDEKAMKMPKKRGAPLGHPGTTRKIPDRYDEQIEVTVKACPRCGSTDLRRDRGYDDHYQEDIVLPTVKVTRYRHYIYLCQGCAERVRGVGEGEMPGSYIGPVAKSVATFLRYQMKVPYRKVRLLFHELFHLDFDPSSTVGFDRQVRNRGSPLYEQIRQSLPKQPYLHADETGWRNDGVNHWLWCFIGPGRVLYRIDRSRGSKVVCAMLGKRYGGVLISDFLAAYNELVSRKQRCLVHLLRLIKKWQIYFARDRKKLRYFEQLKGLVKDVIRLSSQIARRRVKNVIDRKADLIGRLRRLLHMTLGHLRADKFIGKLAGKINELVTCLDDPEVCAHNNLAERLLRDNVIMRKVTFGNRSKNGMRNHEVLMSLIQTARLQNLNPLNLLHLLLTKPAAAAAALMPVTG